MVIHLLSPWRYASTHRLTDFGVESIYREIEIGVHKTTAFAAVVLNETRSVNVSTNQQRINESTINIRLFVRYSFDDTCTHCVQNCLAPILQPQFAEEVVNVCADCSLAHT